MATYRELKNRIGDLLFLAEMTGYEKDYGIRLRTSLELIASVFKKETGFSLSQALAIPPETPLGPETEIAYREFLSEFASELEN